MIFVLLLSLYDVIFVLKYRFSTEKDQSEYYSSILKYWLSTSYLYQNELCLCLLLVSNFKLVFLLMIFLKGPFYLGPFYSIIQNFIPKKINYLYLMFFGLSQQYSAS